MRVIKVTSCLACPYLKPYGKFTLQCGLSGEIVYETSGQSWQYGLSRDRLPTILEDKGEIPDWCPLEEVK